MKACDAVNTDAAPQTRSTAVGVPASVRGWPEIVALTAGCGGIPFRLSPLSLRLTKGPQLSGVDDAVVVRIHAVEATMQDLVLLIGRERREFAELRLLMLEALAPVGRQVRSGQALRQKRLHALQLLQLLRLELIEAERCPLLRSGRERWRGLGRGWKGDELHGEASCGDDEASERGHVGHTPERAGSAVIGSPLAVACPVSSEREPDGVSVIHRSHR